MNAVDVSTIPERMNRITFLLLFALTLGLRAADSPVIARMKRMIEMREPVEGKFTVVSSGKEVEYEFGLQANTWFCRNPDGPGGRPLLAGQSYGMTWVAGGNSVLAIPRSETKPLIYGASPEGLTRAEAGALMMLPWIHSGSRFGLDIASTNLTWDGLSFAGESVPKSWGGVRGELIVREGRPIRIECRHKGPGGRDLVRVSSFTSHDADGLPLSWDLTVNGTPTGRSVRLASLKFGARSFPNSDGYTPTLFGEEGREFAIFYSNRTAHVVGENGSLESQPEAPVEAFVERGGWWIWGGVGALLACVIAVFRRVKR